MARRLIRFARENRTDMTRAEFVLWQHLSGKQLGVRFRRQDPIGPWIADFSCRSARLVVEVDGITHNDPERDRTRDRWFKRHGWLVLRFDDDEVLGTPDETIALILEALAHPDSINDPWNIEGQ